MYQISVIVPVYNVEKYLKKCIDSLLAQTFDDKYEILLIDDGSTDGSTQICDQYAAEHAEIRVIHKKNGGLSDARNVGIDEAKGQFICFIDSDDYIAPEMLAKLHENLVNYQADISSVELVDVYEGRSIKKAEHGKIELLDQKAAITAVLQGNQLYAYATNKLFKKTLFETVRFPVGKIVEDAFVIMELLLQVERVVVSDWPGYFYFHRDDSIIGSAFSKKSFDVIEAWEKNADLVLARYPELGAVCQRRVCWAYFFVLDKMLVSTDPVPVADQQKVIQTLKKERSFILSYPGFTKSRKIAIIALSLNLRFYRYLVLQQEKNKRKHSE